MEFYSLLQVTFTANNTVRDRKSYTIYEIEIRSSSTITWVIYKRYSDFDGLHQELLQSLPNLNEKLPALPPKSFTNNFDAAFVEKRKQALEVYLRALLTIPDVVHCDLVARWLEVPDSVRAMLQQPGIMQEKVMQTPMDRAQSPLPDEEETKDAAPKRVQAGKGVEDIRITELLQQLKKQQNKVSSLHDFEDWFFESRPKLGNESIRNLFLGDDSYPGLLSACGNFIYSDIASRAALELLCRLLDVEKNKDASVFLDFFCHLDRHYLKMLQLHLHCLKEHGSRQGAFAIVQILKERLPGLPLEVYLQDSLARQEYFRWVDCKSDSSTLKDTQESNVKAPNLKDINYKALIDSIILDVTKNSQTEQGWRAVSTEAEAGVQITYRKEFNKDVFFVRTIAVFPHSCDSVFKLLENLKFRSQWDIKHHSGRVVESLDDNSSVIQMVYKSYSSPYKYRDFCLLHSFHKTDDGGYMIAYRSIVHPNCPEIRDHARANALPSGMILTPCELGNDVPVEACLLTSIQQLDREGVLILSPDLLGETDEILYSWRQFKYLLDVKVAPQLAEFISSPLDSLKSDAKYLPHAPASKVAPKNRSYVSVSGSYVMTPVHQLLLDDLCKTCGLPSEQSVDNSTICACLE